MSHVRVVGSQGELTGAVYGHDGESSPYRYRLWRTFSSFPHLLPRAVGFVMLNPSTATHEVEDPTVRRCIGYAKAWGFGTLHVGNLFALRSTDPQALYSHGAQPVGVENDKHLWDMACLCEYVVCAWGVHGAWMNRGEHVRHLLRDFDLRYLQLTKAGHPSHPLYLPASLEAQPWSRE